jgi:hypothetical protein
MIRRYRGLGFREVVADIQVTDQNKGMIEIVEKTGLKQKRLGVLACDLAQLDNDENYEPWINWVEKPEEKIILKSSLVGGPT